MVGAGVLGFVATPVVSIPVSAVIGGTFGAHQKHRQEQAKEKFVEEAAPVIDFTSSLQQLQAADDALPLSFDERPLTLEGLEERLGDG
jgi:hypothetical protein